MADEDTRTATCPHCSRPFAAELLGGAAQRHRGFKCPHCRLFVPLERAEQVDSPAEPLAPPRARS